MIAVRMAPPAPPATTCEIIPWTLRSPDCAAAVIAGSNRLTIWPSTPPPIKPEIMLPIIPRSNVGDDLPAPTPPMAPAIRLIRICSMLISQPLRQAQDYLSPPNTRTPPGRRLSRLSYRQAGCDPSRSLALRGTLNKLIPHSGRHRTFFLTPPAFAVWTFPGRGASMTSRDDHHGDRS